MSYYRKQLEDWLKTLEVKADTVLDVGGAQLPVNKRVKKWDVKQYKIIDLPEPHKGESPKIMIDLNDYFEVWRDRGNVVFCLEVMEYIFNPKVAITNLYKMTEKGGTLYITFPFVYPQHEPLNDDCLRYTRRGAVKLLENAGFTIDKIVPRMTLMPGWLSRFYGHEGMRAAKQNANHEEVGYIIVATK